MGPWPTGAQLQPMRRGRQVCRTQEPYVLLWALVLGDGKNHGSAVVDPAAMRRRRPLADALDHGGTGTWRHARPNPVRRLMR